MNKSLLYSALFLICTGFYFNDGSKLYNSSHAENVVVSFIAYNDQGNNLYLDNITAGKRPSLDIAVTSINNIPSDTSFAANTDPFKLVPKVGIVNLGISPVPDSTIKVYLTIPAIGYSDSSVVPVDFNAGAWIELSDFDTVTITPGIPIELYVNTAFNDSNSDNNWFSQYTVYLPGAPRRVLFQEFTSATSSGSAQQNVNLNNFINARFDSIVAIKYHRGVPPPARDSLYLANPVQSDSMKDYYNSTQVPTTIADGVLLVDVPYSDSNLIKGYRNRISRGSPLSLNVTDTHTGDSIKADITVNILYDLSPGNYSLKVSAVERKKVYSPKPAGWFDSVFYDAFRKAYPGINGIPIPALAGTYNFSITYKREDAWVDSLIYTSVYVQNNNSKEVLNSAKARNTAFIKDRLKQHNGPISNIRNIYDLEPVSRIPYWNSSVLPFKNSPVPWIYAELFEGPFLPPGWKVLNPDSYFTFTQASGPNGPSFGGSKSVQMPFYSYPVVDPGNGQRDTLLTTTLGGLQYNDTLRFDYAYAQFDAGTIDSLIVILSTDGGTTFPYTVFRRGGSSLATASSTSVSFIPSQASQWRTVVFPLNTVIGIQQISSEIPGKYELMQNYPNPFNPSTKIKFSIPKASYVKLKVFDITGRELANLVNSDINAGTYNYEFDGSRLASGIYFYTLEAGSFRETKKMILIK